MPWPRLVDPAEVNQARWWFTRRGGWSFEDAEPRAVRTIGILVSSLEYWQLHGYATGLWSERYGSIESEYWTWASPPSVSIPTLAREDDQDSRLADYAHAKEASAPTGVLRRTARELVRAVPEPEWFDEAAILTVNEIDQLVEECRRRFPNSRDDFQRCIRGERPRSR